MCRLELPLSEFYRCKSRKDGLQGKCKKCTMLAQGEWRAKNPERAKEQRAKWIIKNPEAEKARRKKANIRRAGETNKIYNLKRYGMTVDDYNALVLKQNNQCAICQKRLSYGRGTNVDHDHATGKVRGLLCLHCNTGIGNLMDSRTILLSAVKYLDQFIQ